MGQAPSRQPLTAEARLWFGDSLCFILDKVALGQIVL